MERRALLQTLMALPLLTVAKPAAAVEDPNAPCPDCGGPNTDIASLFPPGVKPIMTGNYLQHRKGCRVGQMKRVPETDHMLCTRCGHLETIERSPEFGERFYVDCPACIDSFEAGTGPDSVLSDGANAFKGSDAEQYLVDRSSMLIGKCHGFPGERIHIVGVETRESAGKVDYVILFWRHDPRPSLSSGVRTQRAARRAHP